MRAFSYLGPLFLDRLSSSRTIVQKLNYKMVMQRGLILDKTQFFNNRLKY